MADFAAARRAMVESQIRAVKVDDERIVAAMRAIPREAFVPEHLRAIAYVDEDLRIKGERRAERAPADGDRARYRRLERAHGVFERSLRLPEDADPDAVEARGEHGVLHVRIGKQAAVAPRRIAVQRG